MTEPTEPSTDQLAEIDYIIGLTKDHVNPGLARLLQFGGFGDVEVTAEGCVVNTMSGARFLDFVGGFGVFSLGTAILVWSKPCTGNWTGCRLEHELSSAPHRPY